MARGRKPRRLKGGSGEKRGKDYLLPGLELLAGMEAPHREDRDEHLVELNFTVGNPISGGIPWRTYSELEIQALLKMHFELLEYDTIWRHRDDPANEDGVDLEFGRKSDRRKVLVAVKKNPKKEALAQLVELADHPADQRIYVYVGSATQSFRDKIRNFKSKVEFWDEAALEAKLNETGLSLELKVANSKANEAMLGIMKVVIRATTDKSRTAPPSKLDAGALETFWGLKDRSATANKCAGMAQLMFEDSSRFAEFNYERLHRLVLFILDYIYAYGLLSILNTLEDSSLDLESLLHHVYRKDPSRSNWLMLFQYRRGPVPGAVEQMLQEFVSNREQWKKVADLGRSEADNKQELGSGWTPLRGAAETFRAMGIWTHGLEATIDFLFSECVRGIRMG